MKELIIKNNKEYGDPSQFKPKKVIDKTSCRMWFDGNGIFCKEDGAFRGFVDPRDPSLVDRLR